MNGVAKITINGQDVVLKFGLPAIRRILEKKEQYAIPDAELYGELGLSHILYAGYLNGCMMKDLAPEIPFEIFFNYVEGLKDDQSVMEQAQQVVKVFEDSRYVKPAVEKAIEEAEKKRQLTGMESNPSSTESSGSDQATIVE